MIAAGSDDSSYRVSIVRALVVSAPMRRKGAPLRHWHQRSFGCVVALLSAIRLRFEFRDLAADADDLDESPRIRIILL